MHISEVKRMQEEKDHFMRHEMTHPANYESTRLHSVHSPFPNEELPQNNYGPGAP